jgi:hypothetical protein
VSDCCTPLLTLLSGTQRAQLAKLPRAAIWRQEKVDEAGKVRRAMFYLLDTYGKAYRSQHRH